MTEWRPDTCGCIVKFGTNIDASGVIFFDGSKCIQGHKDAKETMTFNIDSKPTKIQDTLKGIDDVQKAAIKGALKI